MVVTGWREKKVGRGVGGGDDSPGWYFASVLFCHPAYGQVNTRTCIPNRCAISARRESLTRAAEISSHETVRAAAREALMYLV